MRTFSIQESLRAVQPGTAKPEVIIASWETKQLDHEGTIAIEILHKLIEAAQGQYIYSDEEFVKKACGLSEALFKEMDRHGWVREAPTVQEARKEVEALRNGQV